MKNNIRNISVHVSRKLVAAAFCVLFAFNYAQAQSDGTIGVGTDPAGDGTGDGSGIDTRIDNMGYWKSLIDAGHVTPNPDIPVPPAVPSPVASPTDGPDVVIINQTNVGQSESSIIIDPENKGILLNSNNSFGTGPSAGTLYGADNLMSNTFGNTWTGSFLGVGGPMNWGDPTTAIDRNGRYYVNYITPGTFGQGISYSTNAGVSWTATTIASGGSLDKNHMWVDNTVGSPYQNNVYTAWTCFGAPNPNQIEISRSTNGGVSWSPRMSISNAVAAGSHNQGVNIQTGPNGEVYVCWSIYDSWPSVETAIGFTSSSNGGISFNPATRIISNTKGIRGMLKTVRVNSFPSMTVDVTNTPSRGNIYIVWCNNGVPGINTGSDFDVYMIRSTNGGATWSTPIRVNQDPINLGKKHWLPWISCDNVTGALNVVFYDDRNTSATMTEVFSAYSFDQGNTWSDFRVGDVAFTPSPVPGLASGYFGDYLGLDAQGGKVYPCWFDNRTGNVLTYVSPYDLCSGNLNIVHPTLVHHYYEAGSFITASSTITQPTGEATMDAGDYVLLQPGFSTNINASSYFEAYIEGCGGTSRMSESGTESHLENAFFKAQDPNVISRDIKVYPNPNSGNFQVSIMEESEELELGLKEPEAGTEIYRVYVYDLMGREVFMKDMRDNTKLEIDISGQTNGIYFLKVVQDARIYTSKIIKE